MLSPAQIKMIKASQRELGMDEDDYRQMLRSIGGVRSCRDLNNRSFERVMRYFEERGVRRFSGPSGDRFRMRKFHAGIFCSPEERNKIRELINQTTLTLPGFIARMTGGRADSLNALYPRDAYIIIEALKKVIGRKAVKRELTTGEHG